MNRRSRLKDERGYMLAVVMVFTTVLLVSLSGAMIDWQKAMQREREEELIFRGKQFMRAIELWQRKFPGTYPTTTDALLSTNNTRFLRKKWKDPITNSDDWRLIKMNPDGSISGLTIIPSGSPLGPSSFGASGSTRSSREASGGPTRGLAAGTGAGMSAARRPTSLQPGLSQPRAVQSAFNPVLGGIVGVSSKSEKEALKSYNGRTKYNEWEFYYVPRGPQPVQPGQATQIPGGQTPIVPTRTPGPGGFPTGQSPALNPQQKPN
jgi:type II secretory pathway pseudopilin PulG